MENSSITQVAPYSALQIANEFIARGVEDGIKDMTNMKIQKLVYFAHGYCLACQDRPLISENFVAWKHGPVVRRLYDKIKRVRIQNDWGTKRSFNTFLLDESDSSPRINSEDSDVIGILNTVWEDCKNCSASFLSRITHRTNSPWTIIRNRDGLGAKIPNEDITKYFQYLGEVGKK